MHSDGSGVHASQPHAVPLGRALTPHYRHCAGRELWVLEVGPWLAGGRHPQPGRLERPFTWAPLLRGAAARVRDGSAGEGYAAKPGRAARSQQL